MVSKRNKGSAKALPSRTTRYWAERGYRLFCLRGLTKTTNATVQGVELTCELDLAANNVICTYEIDGKEFVKIEKIRKGWL